MFEPAAKPIAPKKGEKEKNDDDDESDDEFSEGENGGEESANEESGNEDVESQLENGDVRDKSNKTIDVRERGCFVDHTDE